MKPIPGHIGKLASHFETSRALFCFVIFQIVIVMI